MKVYDVALLALIGVTGCLIYVMGQRASGDETTVTPAAPQVTPSLKPTAKEDEVAVQSLKVGTLRRFSIGQFQVKPSHNPSRTPKVVTVTRTRIEQNTASAPIVPAQRVEPSKAHPQQTHQAPAPIPSSVVMPAPENEIKIDSLSLDREDHAAFEKIDLTVPTTDLLLDRVVHMAEASPIQPGSRSCGTTVLDTPKSANNVNSVGYKREITPHIGVGLEYVYKDGCYQNAIMPLNSRDMPSDDGVSLRVNMQF